MSDYYFIKEHAGCVECKGYPWHTATCGRNVKPGNVRDDMVSVAQEDQGQDSILRAVSGGQGGYGWERWYKEHGHSQAYLVPLREPDVKAVSCNCGAASTLIRAKGEETWVPVSPNAGVETSAWKYEESLGWYCGEEGHREGNS